MKLLTLFSIGSMAISGLAMATGFDWDGPKDMSQGCGNAIVDTLAADKNVSPYLNVNPGQVISLEWFNNEKTLVGFTSNFGEDVRYGYVSGAIEVSVKRGGYCVVKKVKSCEVGD